MRLLQEFIVSHITIQTGQKVPHGRYPPAVELSFFLIHQERCGQLSGCHSFLTQMQLYVGSAMGTSSVIFRR